MAALTSFEDIEKSSAVDSFSYPEMLAVITKLPISRNQAGWTQYCFIKKTVSKFWNTKKKVKELFILLKIKEMTRVSFQGVKSLGGHFACLCRGFDFYEVKKNI